MKQFLIEAAKFWDGQLARLDYITTTGVSRASRRECPARVRCCRTAGRGRILKKSNYSRDIPRPAQPRPLRCKPRPICHHPTLNPDLICAMAEFNVRTLPTPHSRVKIPRTTQDQPVRISSLPLRSCETNALRRGFSELPVPKTCLRAHERKPV